MTPEHEIEVLKRRIAVARDEWMRVAKSALKGDMRALQNRVEMFEAEPLSIAQSDTERAD